MRRRQMIQLLTTGIVGVYAEPAFAYFAQDLLLPLFPLDVVLLPHTVLPLHIFEERYKEMIHDCLENNWEFGILLVEDQSIKTTGCTASISKVVNTFDDGRMNILVRGQRRFEMSAPDEEKSYLRGKARFLDDTPETAVEEDIRRRAIQLHDRLMGLAQSGTQAFQDPTPVLTDIQLSYRLVAGLPAELGWQQMLLEQRSEEERLNLVIDFFEQLIRYFEANPTPPPGNVI